MLGVIISIIMTSRAPVYKKLTQFRPVLQPIVVHVDGLSAFLFNGVVCEAGARSVIDLDGRGRLWMAELFECCSDGDSFARRHIGCCNFGFCCRAHDVSHYFADDM